MMQKTDIQKLPLLGRTNGEGSAELEERLRHTRPALIAYVGIDMSLVPEGFPEPAHTSVCCYVMGVEQRKNCKGLVDVLYCAIALNPKTGFPADLFPVPVNAITRYNFQQGVE